MGSHFYAYLGRMKLIRRWSLMRNIMPENIQEHSYQVAIIVHGLALTGNKYFSKAYDPAKLVMLALYHDVAEIIVGDMPTPVKYFNPDIQKAYGDVENIAKDRLVSMLPEEFQAEYQPLFFPENDDAYRLVKAADKIAAYIKCVEESTAGNKEFAEAEKSLRLELDKYADLPEVEYFIEEFAKSFLLTLDEMNR